MKKSNYTIHTTLGKALVTLFGEIPDVIEIDKLRNAAKQQPVTQRVRYEQMEATISSKVLHEYTRCSNAICAWEADFVDKNNRLPTNFDIKLNGPISRDYKHKNIADKLLRSWKISIHL